MVCIDTGVSKFGLYPYRGQHVWFVSILESACLVCIDTGVSMFGLFWFVSIPGSACLVCIHTGVSMFGLYPYRGQYVWFGSIPGSACLGDISTLTLMTPPSLPARQAAIGTGPRHVITGSIHTVGAAVLGACEPVCSR